MKKINKMKQSKLLIQTTKRVLIILLLLSFYSGFSQLKLNIDKGNAEAVFQVLFDQKTIESSNILSLEGTKRLIDQVKRFDVEATGEHYLDELKTAASESPVYNSNHFRFKNIKKHIEKSQLMYDYILTKENELSDFLNQQLSKFLLPNEEIDLNIYLLVGGTSDGFARENTFSIDLGFFRDDIEAVKLVMLHEAFHIIQESVNAHYNVSMEKWNKSDQSLYEILTHLFLEGSASYLANPLIIEDPKYYSKWFQGKYRRNLDRMVDNFELFKSMLYRLKYDENASLENVYNLGFSGTWESPNYFVGFRMCELIKKYEGDDFLSNYIRLSPTQFFLNYNRYAKLENKPDYYPVFSDSIEKSISKIGDKIK